MTQRTLIIGGATGIGFAVAELLAKRGDHIILAGRHHDKLQNACLQLQATSAKVESVVLDITDETQSERLGRVNAIRPGLTDTEAYSAMATETRQQMLTRAADNLPAKRYGRAEDLEKGYLFVIDNPFVTGSALDIEGGALYRGQSGYRKSLYVKAIF
ncbi:SDR family oxidoreductase [Citrobacter portucalensis]|uniref:SDR family oxidoreductase n=1 Tax=Citrobacter portucalensis TaxID=1639133 RepID=UPI0022442B89|nr:SDR family oxidoreductase [Citrobacter portucalensis]MCW8354213.1 SDR family oxidoreductase [Citrobacter portucalensis]MCX8995358.1 SDR family oxidoreductase [Citrobacter portucalensis]MCX9044180.1 SDR family oxidoreductase [Citrobacter portucalensis]MCX9054123.1 SDR family oxidoreductase [Citrobacter portucalensis]MCX9059015.1 SDR family oxidoreductase [Citrobacter portucalensis]